jgi:small multidrug resistance pump
MQNWLFLALAIVLEISGTVSMKLSEGLSRLIPTVMIFVFYGLSFTAFTMAIKKIDLVIAYAIWAGLGTAGITLIGFLYFKETASLSKLICLSLIIVGVVGLNLSSTSQ